MSKNIKDLQSEFPAQGEVMFIGLRPGRLEPVIMVDSVLAITGQGLSGDRYSTEGGARQVTLIQSEHLNTVSSFLGKPLDPRDVRRNIVVAGINLLALKGNKFRIGEAIFEYSGEC
jgi:MOSC domain-containing protein YiiM